MTGRRVRLLLVLTGVAIWVGVLGVPAAFAQEITRSPTAGTPTSTVSISGQGFGSTEPVEISFSGTVVATANTDASGDFSDATFQVPTSATPGLHLISAVGQSSGQEAENIFYVTTPWREFHYSYMRAGFNPFEFRLSVGNVSKLVKDWSFSTSGEVESSPAEIGGVAFVGSDDGNVYAVRADGSQLWSFTTGGAVTSSPALGPGDPVVGGIVYVGSSDDNMYALKASTGAELANFTTGGAITSSPALAGGNLYFGSEDGKVYAIDSLDFSDERWSFTTGGAVDSSPAVANGKVYIGSDDDNVYALNAFTGAKVWSFTTGGPVTSSPAVANGVVYVGSFDGNVYALNASTGAELWSYNTTGSNDVFSSPVVANGVVYFGDDIGDVIALNASTGTELWSFRTGFSIDGSPAVANGKVWIGSMDDSLYAFHRP